MKLEDLSRLNKVTCLINTLQPSMSQTTTREKLASVE